MEKRDLTPGSHLSAVARHTAASVEKSCSFEAYRSSQALLVPLGTALIIAAFAILHFGDLVSFDLGGNGARARRPAGTMPCASCRKI